MTPRERNELYTEMRKEGESTPKKCAFRRNFLLGCRVMVFRAGLGRNLPKRLKWRCRKAQIDAIWLHQKGIWSVLYMQYWQT
jgi:hypothetical protein